jgi:hypothetical protein
VACRDHHGRRDQRAGALLRAPEVHGGDIGPLPERRVGPADDRRGVVHLVDALGAPIGLGSRHQRQEGDEEDGDRGTHGPGLSHNRPAGRSEDLHGKLAACNAGSQ